jgi:hypothetical protein
MVEDIIVFFDEFGTPTFRKDRESNTFLGATATIPLALEKKVFEKCEIKFGLLKNKPIKNDSLGKSRIEDISQLLSTLPVQITVSYINLSDPDFQRISKLYEEYGNIMRGIHRGVKKRPLAQILHSHIVDHALFTSICNYAEKKNISLNVSVFLDDWSIPEQDKHITFDIAKSSLEHKITEVFTGSDNNLKIILNQIELMKIDSDRKRFIDIITSVASRFFLDPQNQRYSPDILNKMMKNKDMNHHIEDITKNLTDFMIKFMDKTVRIS